MRRLTIGIAFALLTFSNAAIAQGTVKIGYIDPLSGGGASIGGPDQVALADSDFYLDLYGNRVGWLVRANEVQPVSVAWVLVGHALCSAA